MATGTAVGGGFTTGKLICSGSITVAAGGAILVIGSHDNTVAAATSCTDGTNAYTLLDSLNETSFSERVYLYGAYNCAAGSYTPQINLPGNPGDGGILALPLSGRLTTSSPFGTPIRNALATTNLSLGATLTLTAGDDVAILLIDTGALRAGTEYSPGSGFTERGEVGTPGSNFLDLAAECQDGVSAGTIGAATVVATQANADNTVIWGITVATSGGGGGSSATTSPPYQMVIPMRPTAGGFAVGSPYVFRRQAPARTPPATRRRIHLIT